MNVNARTLSKLSPGTRYVLAASYFLALSTALALKLAPAVLIGFGQ